VNARVIRVEFGEQEIGILGKILVSRRGDNGADAVKPREPRTLPVHIRCRAAALPLADVNRQLARPTAPQNASERESESARASKV
jgi:hypothetical protein